MNEQSSQPQPNSKNLQNWLLNGLIALVLLITVFVAYLGLNRSEEKDTNAPQASLPTPTLAGRWGINTDYYWPYSIPIQQRNDAWETALYQITTDSTEILLKVCTNYSNGRTGATLNIMQDVWTITLTNLQTGQQLGTNVFRGSQSASCPDTFYGSTGENAKMSNAPNAKWIDYWLLDLLEKDGYAW